MNDKNVVSILTAAGFVSCMYDPWQRKLTSGEIIESRNIIFTKDQDWLDERTKSARKFYVIGEYI